MVQHSAGSILRRREPGQWHLLVKGVAADNGYGDPIDASQAGRIAQAFWPPLRFVQVHTAGFYDDAGFCQDCDAPTATSIGRCPTLDTVTVPTATARAWTRIGDSADYESGIALPCRSIAVYVCRSGA